MTIDPDNAAQLERLRKEQHAGLKEVLNDVLRDGFAYRATAARKRKPFRTRVFDCGEPRFNSPEELKELMNQLQWEEDMRKLGRDDPG